MTIGAKVLYSEMPDVQAFSQHGKVIQITFCHFLLATALGNSNNIHEVFLTSPYAVTLPRGFPKDLRKF